MLSLAQINNSNAYTFSDLHKDVYGFRPREVYFQSEEAFERQYHDMCEQLDRKLIAEREEAQANWEKFLDLLDDMANIMVNASDEDLIRILADAENISKEEIDAYGWEVVEYQFDISYGSIKEFLNEQST